jgi:hypothetical protein
MVDPLAVYVNAVVLDGLGKSTLEGLCIEDLEKLSSSQLHCIRGWLVERVKALSIDLEAEVIWNFRGLTKSARAL